MPPSPQLPSASNAQNKLPIPSNTKQKHSTLQVSAETQNRLRAWLHSVPNALPVKLGLPSSSTISSTSATLPPPPPPFPATPEACTITTSPQQPLPNSLALPPPLTKQLDDNVLDDDPQPATTTITATTATANTYYTSAAIDYAPSSRVRERIAKLDSLADQHPRPHSLPFPLNHRRNRERDADDHDETDFDGTSLTLSPPAHHPASSVGSRASRPYPKQNVQKRTRRRTSHDTIIQSIPPELIPPDSANQLAQQLQYHSNNSSRPPTVPPITIPYVSSQDPPPPNDYLEPLSRNTPLNSAHAYTTSPPKRPYSPFQSAPPPLPPPLLLSHSASRRDSDKTTEYPSTPPLPPSPIPHLSQIASNSPRSLKHKSSVRTPTTAPISISVSDTASASGPISSSSQFATSRQHTLPETPPPPISPPPVPSIGTANASTSVSASVTPHVRTPVTGTGTGSILTTTDDPSTPARIPSIAPLPMPQAKSKPTHMTNPPLPNIPPPPKRTSASKQVFSNNTNSTLPDPPRIIRVTSTRSNNSINPPPRPPNYAPPRDTRIPASSSTVNRLKKFPLPPQLDETRRLSRPPYGFDRSDSSNITDRIPSATGGFPRNISERPRTDSISGRHRSDLGLNRSSQNGLGFVSRRASTNAVDTNDNHIPHRNESNNMGVSRPSSLRLTTTSSRKGSERLLGTASELGIGIEHVTSEYFGRTGSTNGQNGMHGSFMRTDSSASNNPVTALRVTFMSVKSYGNTEKSSSSLGEDANGFLGGAYRSQWGCTDMRNNDGSLRNAWKSQWSSTAIGLPSKVAEAAGMLYRSGCIDDYWVIGEVIGEGACSAVRFAERRNGNDQVAVKIVSKGAPDLFCPNGDCREVVALKAMGRHPNVVQCHEIFEDDRFIYIVMELLAGGQMLPRVANSTLYYPNYCENDVITLVRGLTRGLARLHQLGIAHRDVKPENVLFASESLDPTVKLMDFGIAHTNCNQEKAKDMVGTPLYVAPEVLNRKPYGTASDMWSLGVISHILLTGYPPFDDDDLVQLINMVKSKPVRQLGEEWVVISESGRDFVRRLLTRDVNKRLTAEDALAHPWLSKQRQVQVPSSPEKARPTKVQIPPTMESKQDGNIPLIVSQTNLQSFVVRKEWKRMVESEISDRNMKLGMLVALSEKDLNCSESANTIEKSTTGYTNKNSTSQDNRLTGSESKTTENNGNNGGNVSSSRPPRSGKNGRSNGSNKKRLEQQLVHQQEQERLRQKRLIVEADLAKKKQQQKARNNDLGGDRSSSSGSISARNGFKLEIDTDLLAADSRLDDDDTLDESFECRRDADAQVDSSTVRRQRTEGDPMHWRSAFMGRRPRQSANQKSERSEHTKNTRVMGVRLLRRQKHSMTVSAQDGS